MVDCPFSMQRIVKRSSEMLRKKNLRVVMETLHANKEAPCICHAGVAFATTECACVPWRSFTPVLLPTYTCLVLRCVSDKSLSIHRPRYVRWCDAIPLIVRANFHASVLPNSDATEITCECEDSFAITSQRAAAHLPKQTVHIV